VTIPVILLAERASPIVTTRITEYRQTGKPETAEVWIQIGGHVLDATNLPPDGAPSPETGAWVRLEDPQGTALQTMETNETGRFTFGRLRPGAYKLRWRATGHPEPEPRPIAVPSNSGEYDLIWVHLSN
jgi:hypothetical protein